MGSERDLTPYRFESEESGSSPFQREEEEQQHRFARTLNWGLDYDDCYYLSSYNSVCIAKASEEAVCRSNYSSQPHPWKKFYRSSAQDTGSFSQNGVSGYDTPVIYDVSAGRGYACVTYSTTNSQYIAIAMNDYGSEFYLYFSDGTDFTKWGTGIRLIESKNADCVGERNIHFIAYPSLIGQTGSPTSGTDTFKLYYAEDNDSPCYLGGQLHVRRILEFY